MKLWVSLFICMVGLAGQLLHGASDQILLETSLTELSQNALDDMYGEGNFIVRVRIAMTDSQYKVRYTNQSNPKRGKTPKNEKKVYILPGVPALKNIGPDVFNQLPYDSVTSLVKPKVKKILVYLIANRTFSKRKVRSAEQSLRELLSLKENRDTIKTTYKRFEVDANIGTKNIVMMPAQGKVLSIQNLFYLLVVLLLLGGLLTYIFLNRKKGSGEPTGPNVSVTPNIELTGGAGSGSGAPMSLSQSTSMKRYFDFIGDHNIEDFIFLLKNESINPDYVSIILSYIPSHLSAKVMAILPEDVRVQVLSALLNQSIGKRDLIEKLENKLKSAMECFVGGDKKSQAILDQMKNDEKRDLMTLIESTNLEVYQKVRPMVILFEDLQVLSDEEMKLVVSDINLDELATALTSVDQQLYQKVYQGLTGSAQEMVQQYMELKGEDISIKDIQLAQDNVLRRVKALVNQGRINLQKESEEVSQMEYDDMDQALDEIDEEREA